MTVIEGTETSIDLGYTACSPMPLEELHGLRRTLLSPKVPHAKDDTEYPGSYQTRGPAHDASRALHCRVSQLRAGYITGFFYGAWTPTPDVKALAW